MSHFWHTLKRPIIVAAPMANVTDAAFRRMFAKYGKPDVFWTEFVSVEGLLSKGREQLLVDLWHDDAVHPIVAQIFGARPEQFEKVAEMIRTLEFDGIDINMGCPDKGVEKQGAGAALIKNQKLAKEIIRATKRGAGDLPISVKTRIGYRRDEIDEWIPALLEENIAALTIHLRTRDEMSEIPAHWESAPRIVAIRNRVAPHTLLLGNGDIATLDDAHERVRLSGMDGMMVGRGIFGNPWFFSGHTPTMQEKLSAMLEHTAIFEALFKSNLLKRNGALKNFDVMKKHYKAYVHGFDGAKELRIQLMAAKNANEVHRITDNFLSRFRFT